MMCRKALNTTVPAAGIIFLRVSTFCKVNICFGRLIPKCYEIEMRFLGRDATRAFVSGDFSEKGLVDDVEGLGYQDLLGIFDWIKFYEKDYDLVGYLEGTYYNAFGKPTLRLTVWLSFDMFCLQSYFSDTRIQWCGI